ncbi:hypothetical protein [Myxosarcina sp. GI1]|uniref:hypothetical protein n=1 Tax=Myxosarcina sp. GI1 TaxID=1541065 RepID=UPI00056D0A46|nr:hypothetical protein [Myxosarcina sp. GI1]
MFGKENSGATSHSAKVPLQELEVSLKQAELGTRAKTENKISLFSLRIAIYSKLKMSSVQLKAVKLSYDSPEALSYCK